MKKESISKQISLGKKNEKKTGAILKKKEITPKQKDLKFQSKKNLFSLKKNMDNKKEENLNNLEIVYLIKNDENLKNLIKNQFFYKEIREIQKDFENFRNNTKKDFDLFLKQNESLKSEKLNLEEIVKKMNQKNKEKYQVLEVENLELRIKIKNLLEEKKKMFNSIEKEYFEDFEKIKIIIYENILKKEIPSNEKKHSIKIQLKNLVKILNQLFKKNNSQVIRNKKFETKEKKNNEIEEKIKDLKNFSFELKSLINKNINVESLLSQNEDFSQKNISNSNKSKQNIIRNLRKYSIDKKNEKSSKKSILHKSSNSQESKTKNKHFNDCEAIEKKVVSSRLKKSTFLEKQVDTQSKIFKILNNSKFSNLKKSSFKETGKLSEKENEIDSRVRYSSSFDKSIQKFEQNSINFSGLTKSNMGSFLKVDLSTLKKSLFQNRSKFKKNKKDLLLSNINEEHILKKSLFSNQNNEETKFEQNEESNEKKVSFKNIYPEKMNTIVNYKENLLKSNITKNELKEKIENSQNSFNLKSEEIMAKIKNLQNGLKCSEDDLVETFSNSMTFSEFKLNFKNSNSEKKKKNENENDFEIHKQYDESNSIENFEDNENKTNLNDFNEKMEQIMKKIQNSIIPNESKISSNATQYLEISKIEKNNNNTNLDLYEQDIKMLICHFSKILKDDKHNNKENNLEIFFSNFFDRYDVLQSKIMNYEDKLKSSLVEQFEQYLESNENKVLPSFFRSENNK